MKLGLSKTCYMFFSTLSNPTRLAILELLREGSKNVTDIAKELGQEQSMISHNLLQVVILGLAASTPGALAEPSEIPRLPGHRGRRHGGRQPSRDPYLRRGLDVRGGHPRR